MHALNTDVNSPCLAAGIRPGYGNPVNLPATGEIGFLGPGHIKQE